MLCNVRIEKPAKDEMAVPFALERPRGVSDDPRCKIRRMLGYGTVL
jgi:hypothetical protein